MDCTHHACNRRRNGERNQLVAESGDSFYLCYILVITDREKTNSKTAMKNLIRDQEGKYSQTKCQQIKCAGRRCPKGWYWQVAEIHPRSGINGGIGNDGGKNKGYGKCQECKKFATKCFGSEDN